LIACAEHFNEIDGPVNVECFKLKQKCLQLIDMQKKDGHKDDEILGAIQRNREDMLAIYNKVISRMMVYRDKDLYLLPWVLDRLKAHAKASKTWRKVIDKMNKRLLESDERASVKFAFKYWRD
jgi:hypothetical protein